jgi:acyl carrier protein
MDRLNAELKELICRALMLEDVRPEEIDDEQPLFGSSGLGLDSVDALELAMEIEKCFGVRLRHDEEGAAALKSISALAAFVSARRTNS